MLHLYVFISAARRRLKGPPARGLLEIGGHSRQRRSSHSPDEEERIPPKCKWNHIFQPIFPLDIALVKLITVN